MDKYGSRVEVVVVVVVEEEEEEAVWGELADGSFAVCCPRRTDCDSALWRGDVAAEVTEGGCSLSRALAADGGDDAEAAALAGEVRRLGGGMGRGKGSDWGGGDLDAAATRDPERRLHDHQRRRARATRCWIPDTCVRHSKKETLCKGNCMLHSKE
jgi:hypothetical protein